MMLVKLAQEDGTSLRVVNAASASGALRSLDRLGLKDCEVRSVVPVRSGIIRECRFPRGLSDSCEVIMERQMRIPVESKKLLKTLQGYVGDEVLFHVGPASGRLETVYRIDEVVGAPKLGLS